MTDERDPKVSRRYRELGAEEPSRELDQAILSAAHRAADKPHAPLVTPAGRHRWYFAFGAAAILGLAGAVTVQVEHQRPDPEAIPVSPAQAPAAPPERKEGFKDLEERKPERRSRSDSVSVQRAQEQARDTPPAASRPAEPQPAAPALPEKPQESAAAEADTRARGAMQSAEVQRRAEPQAAPEPRAGVLQDRVAASSAPVSPEHLLERIAELRKQGRHEEADKALAEFRQRYPDYRISEEMLKKVERRN